ncbi:DASS family sodium-coupled anion symporter [candidate division KSB1 bacterium]|nr:DASS family sodium-coupled anion symporter [candidate division KSB1 bacterium]
MSDPEPTGRLSAAEERFEAVRRKAGFVLAPLVFCAVWLAPLAGLSHEAHLLAAVVALTVTLWVTEAIPIPAAALLGPALCVLLGVAPAKTVFGPFADPVVFLFIGSFMLAQGLSVHGLDRRIAVSILAHKWVGPHPARILIAFSGVTLVISMWLSNTATTAMMYPIGLSLFAALSRKKGASAGPTVYASGMLLMCAYSSSLGGLGTPVGTPPNLIGLGLIEQATGIHIGFFQWMLLAAPVIILLFVVLYWHVGRKAAADFPRIENFNRWIADQLRELGPLRRGERNAATAFILTALLWIVPGVVVIIAGPESNTAKWLSGHLPESIVALIGATLLFVLPVNWKQREFTLNWRQAADIDWGTILLFGGGLSLGGLMFTTGLADAIGHSLQSLTGAQSLAALTFLFTGIGIILTEFTSNTASANVIIPVALAMSVECGVNPVIPAIGACMGASMAFLLPVSTPPNAIVYGSGLVPITHMIRYGFALDVVAAVVVPLVLLTWGQYVL